MTTHSAPYFPIPDSLPTFDLDRDPDTTILVTRMQCQMDSFIRKHFVHHNFIALDVEFQENIPVNRFVDGTIVTMKTVDIVILQFCVDKKVLIVPIQNNSVFFFVLQTFHLHSVYLSVCPRPIQTLLISPDLVKFRINIVGDVTKIQKYMNINLCSCLDLSSLTKTVDKKPWFDQNSHFHTGISLSTLSQAYLQHSVFKPDSPVDLDSMSGKLAFTNCYVYPRDSCLKKLPPQPMHGKILPTVSGNQTRLRLNVSYVP